jgi:CHAD domain-containing protein
VAPLAATVAAAAAVGVGVALARAGRRRETGAEAQGGGEPQGGTVAQGGTEPVRMAREFSLLEGERLSDGLRRMALAQADGAIELLGAGGGEVDARAVHETRKALKRLRALVRLLAGELGDERSRAENAALRETAARLAGARDSEVLLATLEDLTRRHPRALARRRGVGELAGHLREQQRRASAQMLGDEAARRAVIADLRAFRGRARAWELDRSDSFDMVEAGLRRIYAQGRRRHRRAARGKGRDTRAMHEWRKRVKDLRYAAEALQREGAPVGARPGVSGHGRRSGPGAHARRLRRLARRADDLGELLGEDHDLSVLADLLRAPRRASGRPRLGSGTRRALLRAIERRRREVALRALAKGRRLYSSSPRKLARDIRAAHAESRPARPAAGRSGVRFPAGRSLS